VLNPKWLIVINTVPVIILFMIYFGSYQIIKSLLPEHSLELWLKFGATLACLTAINLGYAITLIRQKKQIHTFYGLAALLVYIPFLYTYGNYTEEMVPGDIPRWMIPGNLEVLVGTFLMPTLAMALFLLVKGLTSENRNHKSGINFLIAIFIPLSWYLFIQILLPLWQSVGDEFGQHLLIILLIVSTLLFIFFLSRGIYILSLKKSETWQRYDIVWKVIVSLVFPLSGLAVSAGVFRIGESIFGDFSHPWFFIIAILNGVLVCLPNLNLPLYRSILFIARSLTFPYVVYFFLVFLPYLPLSIIAIIAVGFGFLMLAPLLLMWAQSKLLIDDFNYLYQYFTRKTIFILFSIGIAILPLFITVTYLQDKKALHAALDYVYEPDFASTTTTPIKTAALERVLEKVSYHKSGRFGMVVNEQQPFLSPYYNWLVLDNLTLSDGKINLLEKIFLGKAVNVNTRTATIQNPSNAVEITAIQTRSNFDAQQQAWRSWIDLEMTNFDSTEFQQQEFETTFTLPEGAWISDYYLWVNDEKMPGILAEKKAATWIYQQITTITRKDPGILYYLTGNKVAFKVFPFRAQEKRKTGFEILHKEPTSFTIDDKNVILGNDSTAKLERSITSMDGNVVYIPTQMKKKLPIVQRKPYFHFIIDCSVDKEKSVKRYMDKIESLLSQNVFDAKTVKFTLTNAYTKTFDYSNNWRDELNKATFQGGFYLERAIKEILVKDYEQLNRSYPIIVIVTDSLPSAILDKDFADFKMTFPESDLFYELNENGKLQAHSLTENPTEEATYTTPFQPSYTVLAYPNATTPIAYLPNDNQPSIVLKNTETSDNQLNLKSKNWDTALTLHGKWLANTLHPESGDRAWLDLVKASFTAQIMTPVTSFIVVENEAQRAALQSKQAKVLQAKKSLDLGDDVEQMSEPPFLLLCAMFGFLFYLLKFYRVKI